MAHPFLALIWESWRLSRRWYLWVLALAFAIDFTLMRQGSTIASGRPPGVSDAVAMQILVAPSVFLLNFMLAVFATLLAISVGNRAGFPLTFEFRLPVRTPVLLAVPMLTLAALCASLYALPILVCRLLFGVPFPILPASMLIGTLVIILLACSWAATATTTRSAVVLGGLVLATQIFSVLRPLHLDGPQPVQGQVPRFNADIVSLTGWQYVFLGGVCLLLYAMTVAAMRKQRCGEAAALVIPRVTSAKPRNRTFAISTLVARASDLVWLPCPVTSPWRAELWLELKRQVTPIVVFSLALAAAVPLFFLFDFMPQRPDLAGADYLFPLLAFLTGIGIAVFNRRTGSAGYMTAFEGTRCMSTLQLASLQVLSVTAGTLLGIAIVCLSIHLSSPLRDEPGLLALRLRELATAPGEGRPLFVLADAVMQAVIYVSAVMLLFCAHTWSVVWGRWVPYGAGIATIYMMVFAARVRADVATVDDIRKHMWAFAVSVFLLTVLAFGRTLYLKILSLRTSLVAILCWGFFLACSLYSLAQEDIHFARQASELQAFNAALLVLPLLLFVLLLWSYDRLRHR